MNCVLGQKYCGFESDFVSKGTSRVYIWEAADKYAFVTNVLLCFGLLEQKEILRLLSLHLRGVHEWYNELTVEL